MMGNGLFEKSRGWRWIRVILIGYRWRCLLAEYLWLYDSTDVVKGTRKKRCKLQQDFLTSLKGGAKNLKGFLNKLRGTFYSQVPGLAGWEGRMVRGWYRNVFCVGLQRRYTDGCPTDMHVEKTSTWRNHHRTYTNLRHDCLVGISKRLLGVLHS